MAASFISSSTTLPTYPPLLNPKFKQSSFSSLSISPNSNPTRTRRNLFFCFAAKQQQSGPVKKRQSSTNNNKKPPVKNKSKHGEFKKGFGVNEEENDDEYEETTSSSKARYQPLPLPKPPAGFLVDGQGKVVAVSDRRIATIVCFPCLFNLMVTACY
ncbi:hypothetical protein SSX86_031642 [Deinandra increscens subsp. villosa]|uniref:Uncharacterized protein n=1 Tax=Deinandra increscens subsp. villosa TaxID=3103831 RepID=A0AAP0C970_9ASTR